ncbi:MAG: Cytochrome subunit of sulfide dehydrogenase [Pseudomonadota bacterium]|jgi:cytochrome c553
MQWNQLGIPARVTAGVLAAMVLTANSAQAQSAEQMQARNLAASCSGCHGTHGIAEAGHESLAGVNKDELLKKMLDFKTGKKPATVMHQLSKGYSDEQLATLASYFSNLKK